MCLAKGKKKQKRREEKLKFHFGHLEIVMPCNVFDMCSVSISPSDQDMDNWDIAN